MATAQMTVTLNDREFSDLSVTAYEGGIGYWAIADEARLVFPKGQNPDGSNNYEDCYYADSDVFDVEEYDGDPGAEPLGRITRQTFNDGVSRILSGEVKIRSDIHAQVASILTDEYDVDAEAADCIVQAGLFGEIVYG